jgi:type IV secretory pathway VirB4 component
MTNSRNVTNSGTPKKAKFSTLAFVEVSEIRDDTLLLRDGQLRCVLAISSANFALKSNQEQDQIIGSFQGILNSLDFPIQILVQSRRLDLNPYLEKLRALESVQDNDLLQVKMQEYIEYIKQMSQEVNIMDKNFYIIIGFEPVSIKMGVFGRFMRALNPTRIIKQRQEDFLKNKKILQQRVDQIAGKMGSLDLKVSQLKTEQLITLLYNYYNPDTLESIRLSDVSALDVVS